MYSHFLMIFLCFSTLVGTDIPVVEMGMSFGLPDWEYSSLRLSHYKEKTNIDALYFTRELRTDRADRDEGILFRKAPEILVYKDFIDELDQISNQKGPTAKYTSLPISNIKNDVFQLETIKGFEKLKKLNEYYIRTGLYHSLERYYQDEKCVYVIKVWNAKGPVESNERLEKVMSLVKKLD